ncbi:hypothetical protein DFH11DRAFT_1565648 [Phellopilus nigrolimitatus]|nr:hypothetical protein DFH11DRAFT_1565648 [Phellopilus nigrolimitatus]
MPSYVISGAARGIGFEFVNQLSGSPHNTVFALVRNKNTVQKLEALARSNIHILEADITDLKALKVAAQEVSKVTGGNLDVLINNAAFYESERKHIHLDEYSEGKQDQLEEDLRKSFDVNVIGTIHTTNVFLPLVRAGTIKKVLTLSSGVGDLDFTLASGFSLTAPYCISKAALNMAVAKYAMEYKKDGLVFLSISPGLVATDASAPANPSKEELATILAMVESFRKVYPGLNGPITPEESVRAMLNLVDNATIEETGTFISHKGTKEWL